MKWLLCALLFTSLGTSAFAAESAENPAQDFTFAERASMAAVEPLKTLRPP